MISLFKWWFYGISLIFLPQSPVKEFYILPSSTLEIQGYSNVNNFACSFKMNDNHYVSVNYNPNTQKFESALVQFPVVSFDCGGRLINKDFRDLLNEKEFPRLNIRLLEIEPLEEDKVLATLEFEIAGVKNIYKMPASFEIRKGYYRSIGAIELDIEDFGLKQPKRLLGMIVVSTKIDVQFKIDFV